MDIILRLTVLQLMLIANNIGIGRFQGNWYCSPLANTRSCVNSSNYVGCQRQNSSCTAYSCNTTSTGCSCKLGSYICSSSCNNSCNSSCNYDVSSDYCNCNAATHSCTCLADIATPNNFKNLSAEKAVDLLNDIASISGQLSPDEAKNLLQKVDSIQVNISGLVSAENKDSLVSVGNAYLNAFENLASALVEPTENVSTADYVLNNTEVKVVAVGPNASAVMIPSIRTGKAQMEIDLFEVASQSTSRKASVAFISYSAMEDILKPKFFNSSENIVNTMMSTVISATVYQTDNTKLSKPVNFSITHIKDLIDGGSLSCVYWNISEWIVDGCSVLTTSSSYTICSCVHLSTFALIMQTSKPSSKDDPLLELLNLVCVIVGLLFFSLALLSFIFCQWSPGVNNVARVNICISLLLAHLLLLLTQQFLSLIGPQKVLCVVISGLLHFLFLSGFVWMFIEAVLLFISVKNLSQIGSKKKEALSSGFLCVIGYVVALVVVGVSVGLVPEGYGSEKCWIKTENNFIWSFLGPVCIILALNTILFIKIVILLNSTLKNLNADVSKMKQTKIMVFKTLGQFVVLGCPWFLGFFCSNYTVEILFLILNSQQGTFIFLIYCVLNNEIMQQYKTCFSSVCSGHKKL